MTRRIFPTLVVACVCAFPAAAAAQTTGGYATPAPTAAPVTPAPKPTTTQAAPTPPASGVAAETATGTPAAAPAPAATGTTPTRLAYTGSESWLIALVGLLALTFGVTLVRSSRRA